LSGMKKKYRQRNRSSFKKIPFILFGLLLLFILLSLLLPTLIPRNLIFIGKPLWFLRETVLLNLTEARDLLRSKSELIIKNKEEKKEIEKLQLQNLRLNLLEKENAELKSLLGRKKSDKMTLARVLAKGAGSIYDSLIIDLGEKDVRKGDKVFVEGAVLVGLIDEVFGKNSRVKLLSASGNSYKVEVGLQGIRAKATGRGGGNFEIILPRGVEIGIGDEIISPAFEGTLVGVVDFIDSRPQDSFQKILFKAPWDINQIKWVLVERNE